MNYRDRQIVEGKQFSPEMIEMVVHLKSHFDEARKSQKFVSSTICFKKVRAE